MREENKHRKKNLPIQWPSPSGRSPLAANEVFPFYRDDGQMQLHKHYEYYLPNSPIRPECVVVVVVAVVVVSMTSIVGELWSTMRDAHESNEKE